MESDSDSCSDDVSTTSQLTSSSRGASSLCTQHLTSSSSTAQQGQSSKCAKDPGKPGTGRRNVRRKNIPYSPSDQTISLTSQDETNPCMSMETKSDDITTDSYSEPSTFLKTNTFNGHSDGELLSSKFQVDSANTFESSDRFHKMTESAPTNLRTRTTLPTLSSSTRTQSNFQTLLNTSEDTTSKTTPFSATGRTDSGDTSDVQGSRSMQYTNGSQTISTGTHTRNETQGSLEVSSSASDTIKPRQSISRRNNRNASSQIESSRHSKASSGLQTHQQSGLTSRGTSLNSRSRTENSGITERIMRPRKGILLNKDRRASIEGEHSQPYIRGILPSESDGDQSYRLTDGKPRFKGELPQRISAGMHRRKRWKQNVPNDNLAHAKEQMPSLNINKSRKSSQQRLAENLERTKPPQVSAQVKHCFFPEDSLDCDEPCGYGGCDPCGEDGYSDCDAKDKADVRFMRAKMIKLEDTLELMYKKFKLHEDNIDEMQVIRL